VNTIIFNGTTGDLNGFIHTGQSFKGLNVNGTKFFDCNSTSCRVGSAFTTASTTNLGVLSTDNTTISDASPVLTNLQAFSDGITTQKGVCWRTDTLELGYYSDYPSGTCGGEAESPFYRAFDSRGKLVENIEYLANLDSKEKEGWQTFSLINFDTEKFTVKIMEIKRETSFTDLLQIVVLGTYATEKFGDIKFIVLDANDSKLNAKDGVYLRLEEGQEQVISFETLPKDFIVSSASFKVYGYYINYEPIDNLKDYSILARKFTNNSDDSVLEYAFEVAQKTKLSDVRIVEFSLSKKFICADLTASVCSQALESKSIAVLNEKIVNFDSLKAKEIVAEPIEGV
jgi:hypothetical protein